PSHALDLVYNVRLEAAALVPRAGQERLDDGDGVDAGRLRVLGVPVVLTDLVERAAAGEHERARSEQAQGLKTGRRSGHARLYPDCAAVTLDALGCELRLEVERHAPQQVEQHSALVQAERPEQLRLADVGDAPQSGQRGAALVGQHERV